MAEREVGEAENAPPGDVGGDVVVEGLAGLGRFFCGLGVGGGQLPVGGVAELEIVPIFERGRSEVPHLPACRGSLAHNLGQVWEFTEIVRELGAWWLLPDAGAEQQRASRIDPGAERDERIGGAAEDVVGANTQHEVGGLRIAHLVAERGLLVETTLSSVGPGAGDECFVAIDAVTVGSGARCQQSQQQLGPAAADVDDGRRGGGGEPSYQGVSVAVCERAVEVEVVVVSRFVWHKHVGPTVVGALLACREFPDPRRVRRPSTLCRMRSLKKPVLVLAALIVMALGGLVISRPWSIAALSEGYPSRTWPADGNFVQQGEILPAASVDSPLVGSPEFDAAFEDSGGMAFVVAYGGEIVFARHGEGYSPDTAFNSFSMAKSLVGLLAVKAISDGEIAGLDVTVGSLWDAAVETELSPVTVGELLDMRSGIAFEKPPGAVGEVGTEKKDQAATFGPFGSLAQLHVEGVDEVLPDARLIEADRAQFSYQNLNTALLARVLEEVYDTPIEQLLFDKIAEPSGAGGFRWRQYSSDDRVSAYCCLFATAEWWVAVAQFVMSNGIDNGGEVAFVSPEWHAYLLGRDLSDESILDGEYRSQLHYNVLDREGEDLQGPFVYFSGLGGQMVYLVPDSDLIVVRFGERYQLLHTTLYQASDLR